MEFLEYAFKYADLGDWKDYVEIDKKLIRPQDVDNLIGDATKAKNELNWKSSLTFHQLIELMVDSDDEFIKKEISP